MSRNVSKVQLFSWKNIHSCDVCPYNIDALNMNGYPTAFCYREGKKINVNCPVYEGSVDPERLRQAGGRKKK